MVIETRKSPWAFILALLAITTFAVAGVVHLLLREATETLLHRKAEDISRDWATYFTQRLPDVEAAFRTRTVTDAQIAVIGETKLFGKVFRFKMFAADGRLFYVSDEGRFSAESDAQWEGAASAEAVLSNGTSLVSIEDGKDTPNRPDHYAEAYVPVRDGAGSVIGVMEIYTDQTDMKQALDAIFGRLAKTLPMLAAASFFVPSLGMLVLSRQKRRQHARLEATRHDPLTGAMTRGSFLERAQEVFQEQREKRGRIGLLFLDADRFKDLNDTFGHAAGDAFLSIIVARIKTAVRPDTFIGRIGGDEFAVLLPGIEEETLQRRASEICNELSRPFDVNGRSHTCSVSIGVALVDPGCRDAAQALAEADSALYAAKRAGRGRVAFAWEEEVSASPRASADAA